MSVLIIYLELQIIKENMVNKVMAWEFLVPYLFCYIMLSYKDISYLISCSIFKYRLFFT